MSLTHAPCTLRRVLLARSMPSLTAASNQPLRRGGAYLPDRGNTQNVPPSPDRYRVWTGEYPCDQACQTPLCAPDPGVDAPLLTRAKKYIYY